MNEPGADLSPSAEDPSPSPPSTATAATYPSSDEPRHVPQHPATGRQVGELRAEASARRSEAEAAAVQLDQQAAAHVAAERELGAAVEAAQRARATCDAALDAAASTEQRSAAADSEVHAARLEAGAARQLTRDAEIRADTADRAAERAAQRAQFAVEARRDAEKRAETAAAAREEASRRAAAADEAQAHAEELAAAATREHQAHAAALIAAETAKAALDEALALVQAKTDALAELEVAHAALQGRVDEANLRASAAEAAASDVLTTPEHEPHAVAGPTSPPDDHPTSTRVVTPGSASMPGADPDEVAVPDPAREPASSATATQGTHPTAGSSSQSRADAGDGGGSGAPSPPDLSLPSFRRRRSRKESGWTRMKARFNHRDNSAQMREGAGSDPGPAASQENGGTVPDGSPGGPLDAFALLEPLIDDEPPELPEAPYVDSDEEPDSGLAVEPGPAGSPAEHVASAVPVAEEDLRSGPSGPRGAKAAAASSLEEYPFLEEEPWSHCSAGQPLDGPDPAAGAGSSETREESPHEVPQVDRPHPPQAAVSPPPPGPPVRAARTAEPTSTGRRRAPRPGQGAKRRAPRPGQSRTLGPKRRREPGSWPAVRPGGRPTPDVNLPSAPPAIVVPFAPGPAASGADVGERGSGSPQEVSPERAGAPALPGGADSIEPLEESADPAATVAAAEDSMTHVETHESSDPDELAPPVEPLTATEPRTSGPTRLAVALPESPVPATSESRIHATTAEEDDRPHSAGKRRGGRRAKPRGAGADKVPTPPPGRGRAERRAARAGAQEAAPAGTVPGFVEYRPSGSWRYVIATAFAILSVLAVVSIFATVGRPSGRSFAVALVATAAACLSWWMLLNWSPRIISISNGVLEITHADRVVRVDLAEETDRLEFDGDPRSRSWRAVVRRPEGNPLIIRAHQVRPDEFMQIIEHHAAGAATMPPWRDRLSRTPRDAGTTGRRAAAGSPRGPDRSR